MVVFLLHKTFGVLCPIIEPIKELAIMNLLRKIILVSMIVSSGFCFGGPKDDLVISIKNKIYNDPIGKKVEIAEILIRRVNNDVLDKISKIDFNRLLSKLVLKYGEEPKSFSYFLFSDADEEVSTQAAFLIEVYALDKEDIDYVELMIKETGMSKLLQMEKKELGKTLITFYKSKDILSDKSPQQLEWPNVIEISEPKVIKPIDEEIRTTGIPNKNHVAEGETKRTESRSVIDRLADYIIHNIYSIYLNEEKANKQFKDLKLKSLKQFVEKSLEDMTIDLFYEGHLTDESINLLSDSEVFGEITKTLGLRKDMPEFCDYLSSRVKRMIEVMDGKKLVNDEWEEGLEGARVKLYGTTSNPTDEPAMMKFIRAQIKNKVELSDIIKKRPELFTDENLLYVLKEARETESLKVEEVRLSLFESLLEAKKLKGDNVVTLENEYKSTKTYLDKEKDLNIFETRLEALLGIKEGDVVKALDLLIKNEGKLTTESYIELFFGTKKREFKDGLSYRAQRNINGTGVKEKLSLLYLLVLGNNDSLMVKGKQVPVENLFAKFLSQGNKKFFYSLESLDVEKFIKEAVRNEVTTKISERVKVIIEMSKRAGKEVE